MGSQRVRHDGAPFTFTFEILQEILELTLKKHVLFIMGDWNAKVGSQEIPGKTGNLALEYKVKQGKGKQSFAKRTHWS